MILEKRQRSLLLGDSNLTSLIQGIPEQWRLEEHLNAQTAVSPDIKEGGVPSSFS